MSDADLAELASDRSSLLAARGRGYPSSFTCGIVLYLVAVFIWVLGLVFWVSFVHTRIVFVEAPFLSASSIPYYNYPLVMPPTDTALAEAFSLDWFIYASDLLLFFVAFYILATLVFALLQQIRSLNSLGFSIVVTLILLVQLAKSVYFSLYWFDASTSFSCKNYPFCVNRNPAEPPDSADTTFLVEIYFTYAYTLLTLVLYGLPSVYKSASIQTLRIGSKCIDCGDKLPSGSSLESGSRRTARPKKDTDVRQRKKRAHSANARAPQSIESQSALSSSSSTLHTIPDISFGADEYA